MNEAGEVARAQHLEDAAKAGPRGKIADMFLIIILYPSLPSYYFEHPYLRSWEAAEREVQEASEKVHKAKEMEE